MNTSKITRQFCNLLFAGLFLCLGLVSCEVKPGEDNSVQEVRFSGHTGVPATKTEYAGGTLTAGSGDWNGQSFERIDWTDGDRLTIISPDSQVYKNPSGDHSELIYNVTTPLSYSKAEYKISSHVKHSSYNHISVGTITNLTTSEGGTGSGLLWSKTGSNQTYRFYGIYPTSASITLETADLAKLTVGLPATQAPRATRSVTDTTLNLNNTNVSAKWVWPDMSNASMYAASKAVVATEGTYPNVNIDFYPMVTTFQFTVGKVAAKTEDDVNLSDKSITLESVELSSKSCAMAGNFVAQVSVITKEDPNWAKYASPGADEVYPNPNSLSKVSYTSLPAAPSGDEVSVAAIDLSGKNVKIDEKDGKSTYAVITLFVLPKGIAYNPANSGAPALADWPGGSTITDLTVRFKTSYKNRAGSTVKVWRALDLRPADPSHVSGVTLSSKGFVEFPAGKKINISGITLPVQLDPWRFSVATADYEEELSDVVITPVKVVTWDAVEGTRIDNLGQTGTCSITIPATLSVTKGKSVELKATVKHTVNSVETEIIPSAVKWDISSLDATKAALQPGQNASAWIHGIAAEANAGTVKASVTIGGQTYESATCTITVTSN